MSAKFKGTNIVYSTSPNFDEWDDGKEDVKTPPPEKQTLYISLDKKQRRGKKVTLITGFVGDEQVLKDLGKILKSKCGVGGSVKDKEVIIQGDFRDKIKVILLEMNYKCKTKG